LAIQRVNSLTVLFAVWSPTDSSLLTAQDRQSVTTGCRHTRKWNDFASSIYVKCWTDAAATLQNMFTYVYLHAELVWCSVSTKT